MRTVTFDTQVHDGLIKIPERYKNLEDRDIEVILIVKDSMGDMSVRTPKTARRAKGILSKQKKPDLISKEKSAWEMVVKEKHAHR